MSYPQFLLNLHIRSPLHLSVLMDYSTCFVYGVFEESVLFFPGTKTFPFTCISRNKHLFNFNLMVLFAFFLLNRLEKDRNYNYFWVRCAKLVCVSLLIRIGLCFQYANRIVHLFVVYVFCRLLCLRFTVLHASIISLLLVIMTQKGHGLEHLWRTFLSKVCGLDMSLRFTGLSLP